LFNIPDTIPKEHLRTVVNELPCKLMCYNVTVLIMELKTLGIRPTFS